MTLKLKNFEIGGDKLTILAGPCAIESMDVLKETAEGLKIACSQLGINYVFKSSFSLCATSLSHAILPLMVNLGSST